MCPRPHVGEPLPDAHLAVIPPRKLEDYCLNPDHASGGHKAQVFAAALGIHREDAPWLAEQILAQLPAAPVISVAEPEGERVLTARVALPIVGRNGRRLTVLTIWKMMGARPHLVSAFVKRRAGGSR